MVCGMRTGILVACVALVGCVEAHEPNDGGAGDAALWCTIHEEAHEEDERCYPSSEECWESLTRPPAVCAPHP